MRLKPGFLAVPIYLLLSLVLSGLQTQTYAAPNFANDHFKALWQYSDKAVDEGGAGRGYTWGPNVFGNYQEDYLEGTGGKRQVEYFDKSRMELSSNGTFVTNGLLTKELVTGLRQDGDAKFTQLTPSQVQIAGDPNEDGKTNSVAPTYASFSKVVTVSPGENVSANRVGQMVNQSISREGMVSTLTTLPDPIKYSFYDPNLKHNIADVFYSFMYQKGRIWNGSAYVMGNVYTDQPFSNVFGLPVSEAFWTRAVVSGVEKNVMVQLFERRVLTYTPTNSAPYKVEMGNIGQHYQRWRYANANRPPVDTLAKADPDLVDIIDLYDETPGTNDQKLKAAQDYAILIGVLDDTQEVELEVVLNKGAAVDKVTNLVKLRGGTVEDESVIVDATYLLVGIPFKTFVGYANPSGQPNFLRELTALNEVYLVNLPFDKTDEELHNLPQTQAALLAQAAATKNQGVKILGADKWQAAGYTGKGVTVGIIDGGYKYYQQMRDKGVLPSYFEPLDYGQKIAGSASIDKSVHGTAVAEIIHSIAPDAKLLPISVAGSDAEFSEAIDYFVAQKVDMVSVSMGGNTESEDGNSALSRKIEQVRKEKGILFFFAAGNEGSEHYGGMFTPNAKGYQQFQPNISRMAFGNPSSGSLKSRVILRWDQWLNGDVNPNAADLDLFVVDESGNVIANSDGDQRARPPLESLSVNLPANTNYYIRVKLKDGAPAPTDNLRLHVFVTGGIEPQFMTPVMSVGTNADSRGAIAVGAIDPPEGDKIGNYSSQGPLSDGRYKPEICGPAGVNSAAYEADGEGKFPGTSAATPEVSGMAALLKSSNLALTADELTQVVLESTQSWPGGPANGVCGYGRADLSVQTIGPVQPKGGPLTAPAPNRNPEMPLQVSKNYPAPQVDAAP